MWSIFISVGLPFLFILKFTSLHNYIYLNILSHSNQVSQGFLEFNFFGNRRNVNQNRYFICMYDRYIIRQYICVQVTPTSFVNNYYIFLFSSVIFNSMLRLDMLFSKTSYEYQHNFSKTFALFCFSITSLKQFAHDHIVSTYCFNISFQILWGESFVMLMCYTSAVCMTDKHSQVHVM